MGNEMNDPVTIRDAAPRDAEAICDIYNYYIENTVISFEETLLSGPEMAQRIAAVTEAYPWLVAHSGDRLVGYAYANRWKHRSAYRYCVESTVYVRQDAVGGGIGRALYAALIENLRARGIRIVIGCISLPNPASVALHEALGFRQVSCFPQVGFKFDRWIDVGDWQLTLT